MKCPDAALYVLEDVLTTEVDQHLAECPRCRGLREAHSAALSLRGLGADWATMARSAAVQPTWRRGFFFRTSLVVAISFCAAAAVAFIVISSAPGTSPADVTVTARAAAASSSPSTTADSDLESLIREIDSYTRRDVATDDTTLATFGPLPTLLTPSARNAAVPASILGSMNPSEEP